MQLSASAMYDFLDVIIEHKFTHQVCQVLEGKHN